MNRSRAFRTIAILSALIFGQVGAASWAAASIFDDAVAAWNMADGRGRTAGGELQSSGTVAFGAQLQGDEHKASLDRGGDGRACRLDGSWLSAGNAADGPWNLAGRAMTLCVRLKNTTGASSGTIVSKGGDLETLQYRLFANNAGEKFLAFELGSEGVQGVRQLRASQANIAGDGWHDVIARYDGRAIELFIDGKVCDEYLAADPLRRANAEPLLIGAESVGGKVSPGFRGLIDHVAIWKRALRDEEIARLSGVKELKYPDIYREKYRPQFHFTARRHWINDPNGLVYYDGEYHQYFQYMPAGRPGAYKDWGHSVSRDLVHWTQLPTAVSPQPKLGGCWSGSAAVDTENTTGFGRDGVKPIIAAVAMGGDPRQGPPCTQCIAYSLDRGRSFTFYEGNPVVKPLAVANRDPKILWHEPSKRWIMVFYLSRNDFAVFNSPDLKNWTRLENVQVPGSSECPDFFELAVDGDRSKTKWVFWAANGKYWLGTFDGKSFHREGSLLQADYGSHFYAAQTFSDIPASDGRSIQVAWMAVGGYPGMPFTQQISFPCALTLRTTPDGVRLFREPVKEIALLRENSKRLQDVKLLPGDNPLASVEGDLFEIEADLMPGDASHIGFEIRGQKVQYGVKARKLLSVARTADLEMDHGRVRLHILVDRTSIEVFANDGRLSMSACFIPNDQQPPLKIYSLGGAAEIKSLTVHKLRSAWQ